MNAAPRPMPPEARSVVLSALGAMQQEARSALAQRASERRFAGGVATATSPRREEARRRGERAFGLARGGGPGPQRRSGPTSASNDDVVRPTVVGTGSVRPRRETVDDDVVVSGGGSRRHEICDVRASSRTPDDCEGWTKAGYFCANMEWNDRHALTESEVCLMQRAFKLINDNIDLVERYFDLYVAHSGHCVITRVTGGDFWYPSLMMYKTIPEYDPNWNATTLYGSRYIRVVSQWLNAAVNSWNGADDAQGNEMGEDCAVVSMARLILHETAHSCFFGEKVAWLMSYHFGRSVADRYGLNQSLCCSPQPLPLGYRPESYEPTVRCADPTYEKADNESDGSALYCGQQEPCG